MSIPVTLWTATVPRTQTFTLNGTTYTVTPKKPQGRPKGKDLDRHIARALCLEMVQVLHPDLTTRQARLEAARVLSFGLTADTLDVERAMRQSIANAQVALKGLTLLVMTGDAETPPLALAAAPRILQAFCRMELAGDGWLCPWGSRRATFGRITARSKLTP